MKATAFSHNLFPISKDFPLDFINDQDLEFDRNFYYENPSKNSITMAESDVVIFASPGMEIPSSLLDGYHSKDILSKETAGTASKFLYELSFIELAIKRKKKIILLGDSIVMILMKYGMKFCQNVRNTDNVTPAVVQIGRGEQLKTEFLERSFIMDDKIPSGFSPIMIRRPKFATGYMKENTRSTWKSKRYAHHEPIILFAPKIDALFIKHVPIVYHDKKKTIMDRAHYRQLFEQVQTFLAV